MNFTKCLILFSAVFGILPVDADEGAQNTTQVIFAVNRHSGIAGKFPRGANITLLRDHAPYTCRAKAGNLKKEINEAADPGDVYTTLLSEVEKNCSAKDDFIVAVVNSTVDTYLPLQLRLVTDDKLKKGLDSTVRGNSSFKLRYKDEQAYLIRELKMNHESFKQPKLATLYLLSEFEPKVYVAVYTPISEASVSGYFTVVGSKVESIGGYWIKDDSALQAFKLNGSLYFMISGRGNITGWVLDTIFLIAPSGSKQVYFNDDWAT